eukprot:CAMPEP_0117437006 /NCGR_PEP_ID=MMETSP0759-20121206/1300_1 /TAXON_ID=63605 /ORGANISM="Percolomonas cosmopolitus, Strain WS" /LENGTH=255 /DNA_ID=CAMNT_0005228623 /DNA_START=1446 /DNA_END=2213 /DNA_ORIENTATION=+
MTRFSDLKTREDRKFCTERCMLRYLRARDFDVDKAEKMLRGTLEWRHEYQPHKIKPHDLEMEASSGKIYVRGKDKMGRPLLFLIPRNENSKDYDKNVRLLVYTLERAIQEMDDGVEQLVLMMDFKGWGRHNSVPISVARQVIHILSNHYPERLGVCYMMDTPWLFSLFWKSISIFLHPNTSSKVKFVSSKDREKVLSETIHLDNLEKRFSGRAEDHDMEVHWTHEIKRFEKRISRSHERTSSFSSNASEEVADMD